MKGRDFWQPWLLSSEGSGSGHLLPEMSSSQPRACRVRENDWEIFLTAELLQNLLICPTE
jgi:hypothetical protein